MQKKSKLTEKPARAPDAFELRKTELIEQCVKDLQKGQSESGKSLRFSHLIKDLFEEVEPQFIEEYSQGVEKFVESKQKDLIIRGRIDSFYGNLIIEFEKDLAKTLSGAEEQLKRYASCLWQESMCENIPYICIATDGLQFNIYTPKIKDYSAEITAENVALENCEKINLLKADPLEAYFFLDRYIIRKEIRHPTTDEFVKDFGPRSVAFQFTFLELVRVWQKVKTAPSYQVVFESWEKYLQIAYGTQVADEELFIKHTYLATLSKILAWQRLSGVKSSSFEELKEVLAGDYFKKIGIVNFLEEDFFSWVVREEAWPECKDSIKKLFNQLLGYNLRQLSEDVLKGLYQGLVDPQTRHDLGEYYTPDWLAEKIVCEMLEGNPKASLLDPACGSGTFLYMAVRYKAEVLGKNSGSTLSHIASSVCGIDIHPLAVIVAKTNYLLALGDLLKKRKGPLVIPIYLADSIKIPVLNGQRQLALLHETGENLPVKLLDKEAYIPNSLFSDRNFYDQVIEEVLVYSQSCATKKEGCSLENFTEFVTHHLPQIKDSEAIKTLFRLADVLKELIEEDRDTIWSFVLKNIYKPIFLQKEFDLIVGNPPWLSYRYIERGGYQDFIKEQVKDYWLLQGGQAALITHLELATLFFVKALDLYLKPEGKIAFVMPRSVFTADHHHYFRGANLRVQFGFEEVWDLEGVTPLFNVPSCVVFGKKGVKTDYPLECGVFRGRLDGKNEKLINAEEKLQIESRKLEFRKKGERSYWTTSGEELVLAGKPSSYKKDFRQGATIVPRSFWFVEPKSPHFGLDAERPYVQTDGRAIKAAKDMFKEVFLEGNIEKEFLYATLLSTDLVPFGHLPPRLVILPIREYKDGFKMLDRSEARKWGFLDLEKWLDKVESGWAELKGEKGERNTAIDWLNYRNKLTNQKKSTFKVLYPTSATNLFGTVVECKENPEITTDGLKISANGFAVESTAYYFETNDKDEAYYLAAFLNSDIVNQAIKPLQARGLFGPRHIHKKVWEFPIPRFDPENPQHQKLAKLGQKSTTEVKRFLKKKEPTKSIGRLRSEVRNFLKPKLNGIDKICRKILEGES